MREEVNEATSQQVNGSTSFLSDESDRSDKSDGATCRKFEISKIREKSRNRKGAVVVGREGACGHLSVRRLSISGKVVSRNE